MNALRLAKDIMATKLVVTAPDDDVFDGAQALLRNRITGMPVVAPDRAFLGMLSERCCLRALTPAMSEARSAGAAPAAVPAREFMAAGVFTLRPEMDSLEAIALLLRHRFSGAPVVDAAGDFLGVFSERYSMRLLVNAAYESVPSIEVGALMNTDRGRLIDEDADLLAIARMFLDSYYRRLPVLRDRRLVGQVSRRDVLRAAERAAHDLRAGAPGQPGAAAAPRSARVADYMETDVQTIDEETDFLTIAQVFLESNRRRLPVLRDGRLVGQVSRRDLLAAVLAMLGAEHHTEQVALYLSAVMEPNSRPLLNRADYGRG